MSGNRSLHLNLASRPARNRSFYLLSRNVLTVAIIILLGLSAFAAVRYGRQTARLKALLAETGRIVEAAGQEEKRLSADADKLKKAGREKAEFINGIILQKSFSWTGFLSQLEAALPDSLYITSLIPNFAGDRTVILRIKVVSRGLDDLLTFLNNLNARKFKYRFESESREDEGHLVSEISLTYERDI
jgi:Tfp pilus assembly protein PilN